MTNRQQVRKAALLYPPQGDTMKEPKVAYEVDEDGTVLEITEYGPEDAYLLADSFEDPNYTQIPNQLLGTWKDDVFVVGVMSDMSEVELKVALALCRVTFGFHREAAPASLSWLERATGLSRQGVLNGIEQLTQRGLFSKGRHRDGRNVFSKAASQQSRPGVVNRVDQASQQSRPKKERLKKEERKASAPAATEPPVKEQDFSVGRLLRGTLTRGEDDPAPRSALAEYIGQQMNSPLSSGNLNKLSLGYTEQLPGGEQRKHPSPDVLWKTHPLYPTFVEERIEYWRGQSGSNAQKRIKVVNSICSYKGNHFSWLDWLSRHSTETTHTPQPDYEPEVPEYDVEELEEWASSIPVRDKTTVWSSEIEDDS